MPTNDSKIFASVSFKNIKMHAISLMNWIWPITWNVIYKNGKKNTAYFFYV